MSGSLRGGIENLGPPDSSISSVTKSRHFRQLVTEATDLDNHISLV